MRALARVVLAAAGLVVVVSLVASVPRPTAAVPTPALTPTPPPTPSPATTTVVVPAAGGVYIEGVAGRHLTLNPLTAPMNQPDRDVVALVFSGLVTRDENGHIAPDLAEQWEVSADGRYFTFLLRSDAKWHDGAPVTADDVVYTVGALQSGEFDAAPWLVQLWQGVDVDKVSERIVHLGLPEPYAPFLQYATLGLLPAHVLAGTGESGKDAFEAHPVGSGPFQVRQRTAGRIVLEAFPDYYGAKPMIPQIEFRFYRDRQSAIAALKAGEVLGVAGISIEEAVALEKEAGIRVHWSASAEYDVILFNLSLPFLDDAEVRRALLMAIDRKGLVETVLAGKGTPGDGPFLPSSWAYAAGGRTWPYDPQGAGAILDKAGWRDTDGDSLRERDGVKLEFALLTNDDETRVAAAQYVAGAWAQIGARVEVHVVSSYGLVHEYLQHRYFEAVLFGWAGIPDDPDPYEMWHSSQREGTGLNFTGFASHRADEILEAARRTGDPSQRKALYARFQDIFADQLPALILYYPMFPIAVSDKLQAVRFSFVTEPGDRFRHFHEWYLMTKHIVVPDTNRVR